MAIYTLDEILKNTGATTKDIQRSAPPTNPIEENKKGVFDNIKNNIKSQALAGGERIVRGFQDVQQGSKKTNNLSEGIQDIYRGSLGMTSGGVQTIFSPITAGIQQVTETKPVATALTAVGDKVVNPIADIISQSPRLQKFAMENPNAEEVIGDIINVVGTITGGPKAKGAITEAGSKIGGNIVGVIDNTAGKVKSALDVSPEIIQAERSAKIAKGLGEQNTRLKTVDKAFNELTITRKTPKGETIKITPIDTFGKYNIAPVIDKGSIQMGDYKNGIGELGKIKTAVEELDASIDTKLVNTGKKISINDLKKQAIENAKSNPEFKQSGTVSQNLAKIENRFEDYRTSYGDEIDVAELNNIRKTANKDYSPDTQDVSLVIGDTARKFVYDALPDNEIKKLLQQQGELLAAKKYAEKLNGTKVTGGRLGNMAMRTAGAVAGSTIQGLPVAGPVIGMLGGEFAARALQQSQFKSLWTEIRAAIQRSNNKIPKINANTIPNNAIPKTVAPKTGIIKKTVDKLTGKGLPNRQGGFAKNPFVSIGDDLAREVKKYKSAEDFANKAPSKVIDELRNQGIRGAEQRMAFWEKTTKGMDKTPVIDSMNPTGGVFVDYTPEARMNAKLADNITTLDKTMGKSPDDMITIYRGAPKNQKSIVGGDFVTTNYDVAKSYTGEGNVLSKRVKLSDVLDDLEDPLGEEYLYRPKSQVDPTLLDKTKTN